MADRGIRGTGSSGVFGMLEARDTEVDATWSCFSCNVDAAAAEVAPAAYATLGDRQYGCRLVSVCPGSAHCIFPRSFEPWRRMGDVHRVVREDLRGLADHYSLNRRCEVLLSDVGASNRLVSLPRSPPLFSQTALSNDDVSGMRRCKVPDSRTKLQKHSGHDLPVHTASLKVGSIDCHRCRDRIVEQGVHVGMGEVLFCSLYQAHSEEEGLSSGILCARENQRTGRVNLRLVRTRPGPGRASDVDAGRSEKFDEDFLRA